MFKAIIVSSSPVMESTPLPPLYRRTLPMMPQTWDPRECPTRWSSPPAARTPPEDRKVAPARPTVARESTARLYRM